MKPSEIASSLPLLARIHKPAFLWGPPGVGKSQVVAQVAAALGIRLVEDREEDVWTRSRPRTKTHASACSRTASALSVNAVHEAYNRRPQALAHADVLAAGGRPRHGGGRVDADGRQLSRPGHQGAHPASGARGQGRRRRRSAIAQLKKGEMAEQAEVLLAGTGWLPEPLRTPGQVCRPRRWRRRRRRRHRAADRRDDGATAANRRMAEDAARRGWPVAVETHALAAEFPTHCSTLGPAGNGGPFPFRRPSCRTPRPTWRAVSPRTPRRSAAIISPTAAAQGRYWLVGDVHNTPGRSLYVRLHGPAAGRGAAGKWTDAATGEHGDLLDLIAAARSLDGHRRRPGRGAALSRLLGRSARPAAASPPPASPTGSPEAARRLFAMARPIAGTLAETYLRQRGIAAARTCTALRFHPRCCYRPDADSPDGRARRLAGA